MDSIEWLFSLFVWHPVRIAGVSCFFLVGFFGMRLLNHKYPLFRNRLLLISGVMWALFSLYEWHCKSQRYNIRVDLFFIYPVLMSVSIGSVLVAVANLLLSLRKNKELEMGGVEKSGKYGIVAFSWLVKAAGVALLLLVLVIAIGEGPPNPFKLKARELFLMISLLVTLTGIILALWWQLLGGVAMIAGMVAFIGESRQWIFWAFALIGVLNVVCWWLKKLQAGRVKLKK